MFMGIFAYMFFCPSLGCLASMETRRECWITRTRVRDSCELPCGCWELNLEPLEEQPVLLVTEPSPSL